MIVQHDIGSQHTQAYFLNLAGVVTHAVQNYSKKFRDPSKAPENQIYTKAVSITKYRFFESCITDPKIVIYDFMNTSFLALIDQKYAKKN